MQWLIRTEMSAGFDWYRRSGLQKSNWAAYGFVIFGSVKDKAVNAW